MAMMNEKLWEIKRNIEKEQSEGIRRQKQRKGKTEQEECEERGRESGCMKGGEASQGEEGKLEEVVKNASRG